MITSKEILVAVVLSGASALGQEGSGPDLIEQLQEDSTADRAIQLLRAEGEAAVPALVGCVASGQGSERLRALLVLRQLGTTAAEAVPHLVTVLESCEAPEAPALYDTIADIASMEVVTSREVQDRMHVATERLLQSADRQTGMAIRRGFVRVLIRMRFADTVTSRGPLYHFEDNFVVAREYAAELLGSSGSDRDLPALRRSLADPDPPKKNGRGRAFGETFQTRDLVLIKSARAVEMITGRPFENVHRHRYWLRYGDLPERTSAARALAQDPEHVQHALPDLIEALDDPSPALAREAITAIGMIGPEAREATPILEELIEHDDPQIVERAKVALRQVRGR